ncbi:fray1 [Symbiodinium sp. CCMP2592]|nr:fray1 [Symbiodinium sp. CCMP2592]
MELEAPCGAVQLSGHALGRGASGRVFLGSCEALGPGRESVAVKVVRGIGRDRHAAGAWRRELRVVRPLLTKPHRNILAYHAAFRFTGSPICQPGAGGEILLEPGDGVLVMERAMRSPLPVGLRPEGDGTWEAERGWRLQQAAWAARVLVSGANALHWLHQVIRTIHRDLKLENLLISEDGVLKLADFSAAKTQLYDLQVAGTRQGIGTTGSMAPELYFKSTGYTSAVDLWSLGCAVVDAFNGSLPYDMDSFLAVVTLGQLKPPSGSALRLCHDSVADPGSKLADSVRRLQESIHRRILDWFPQDDHICRDLSAVLLKLLVPVPDRRLTAQQLLQQPEMRRLAEAAACPLDVPSTSEPAFLEDVAWAEILTEATAQGGPTAVAQMMHQALERVDSVQDLDLLREDVFRALLAEDPASPELLQMFLQLPCFEVADGSTKSLPGWARPTQDALCQLWRAEDFPDASTLVTQLQEHGVSSAKFWAPGRAERLLEDLKHGTSLSLRDGASIAVADRVLRIVHELLLDVRLATEEADEGLQKDGGSRYFCLLEMHSIDYLPDGKSLFPHLRQRPPTELFDPKDGKSWAARIGDFMGGALAPVLPSWEESPDDCKPQLSVELRQSEYFPGLLTRCHRWTLQARAPSGTSALGFATEELMSSGVRRTRHWAWLPQPRAQALAARRARLRLSGVRCQDLSKTTAEEQGQTLLHAACQSRYAARLLRLVSEALPHAKVNTGGSWSELLPLDVRDHLGRTPLWLAASRPDTKAVEQLLSFRSDPEVVDDRGLSPLAVAASTRRSQTLGTVRVLVAAGAEPLEVLKKMDRQQTAGDPVAGGIKKALVHGALAGSMWHRLEKLICEAGGKVSKEEFEEMLQRCRVDETVSKYLLQALEAAKDDWTSDEIWKLLSTAEKTSRRRKSSVKDQVHASGAEDDWRKRVVSPEPDGDSVDVAATKALQALLASSEQPRKGYPKPSAEASPTSPFSLSPKTVRTDSDCVETASSTISSPKAVLSGSQSEDALRPIAPRRPPRPRRQDQRHDEPRSQGGPRATSMRSFRATARSLSLGASAVLQSVRHASPGAGAVSRSPREVKTTSDRRAKSSNLAQALPPREVAAPAETTAGGKMHTFRGVRPRYLDHLQGETRDLAAGALRPPRKSSRGPARTAALDMA